MNNETHKMVEQAGAFTEPFLKEYRAVYQGEIVFNPEQLEEFVRLVEEALLPADRAYIIRFEDPDCRDELFTGDGAKDAALYRYMQISDSWNAHLFVKVDSNHPSKHRALSAKGGRDG
jgi:hypothetical protein